MYVHNIYAYVCVCAQDIRKGKATKGDKIQEKLGAKLAQQAVKVAKKAVVTEAKAEAKVAKRAPHKSALGKGPETRNMGKVRAAPTCTHTTPRVRISVRAQKCWYILCVCSNSLTPTRSLASAARRAW